MAKTFYISIQVSDLDLKTDIHTQKAVLRQVDNDEYELQDLTINELFTTFEPNAGSMEAKDEVEWKVFPMYERDLTNVNVVVSWICSDLKFYEFDLIEEGGQDEI